MANGEDGIKIAARSGDAASIAIAYQAYRESMERNGQKVKTIKEILGK